REIGDRRRTVWALNGIARGDWVQGRLDDALKMLREAIEICREIDDKSGLARQWKNLADLLAQRGELKLAEAATSEALTLAHAAGDRRVEADALRGQAALLHDRGKLPEARQRYNDAL